MNAYKLVIPQTPPVRTERTGSRFTARVVLVEVVTEPCVSEAEAMTAALEARQEALEKPAEVCELLLTQTQ